MTWEIITGMIAITGCLIGVGTVLARLISTLARLDETLKVLQRDLLSERENNKKAFERIFDKIEDHEKRIVDMERDK